MLQQEGYFFMNNQCRRGARDACTVRATAATAAAVGPGGVEGEGGVGEVSHDRLYNYEEETNM